MNSYVLRAENLTKSFGRVKALRRATFSLSRRTITAFLGENGAGKTTTLRLILEFLRPDSGSLETPAGRIGYVPEHPVFFPWLSGKDILSLTARQHGIGARELADKARQLSERLSFDPDLLRRKVPTYSSGNQKKFSYLQSLLLSPEFLIVDEPFAALDPPSIRRVRDLFCKLRSEGSTVFLSSHLVSEMEKICDEFIIISHGDIVIQGDLAYLRNGHIFVRLAGARACRYKLRPLFPWVKRNGSDLVVLLEKSRLALLAAAVRPEAPLAPEPPDLETLFLFFTH
jgi:ABC-2 type transport system ATP-binding protein